MQKNKLTIFLLVVFDFLLIIISFQLFSNLGTFTIDKTINILDFISLVVTIFIAFFVPFLIKIAIDDNRGIKNLLIKEVEDLIKLLQKNHKIISGLYSNDESIENRHRDGVREIFFDAELKIDSLKSQLEISFPSKKKLSANIFEDVLKYKQFLTDGKFMVSSTDKIDYDFYRNEKNAFAEFEKSSIKHIHEIHKF